MRAGGYERLNDCAEPTVRHYDGAHVDIVPFFDPSRGGMRMFVAISRFK
jgi:hypothetical protein